MLSQLKGAQQVACPQLRLMPSKLPVPTWSSSEEIYRDGSKRVWSDGGHSSDWLAVRWVGVNFIYLLVPSGLGSTCLWAACNYLLPSGRGFNICKTAQVLPCASLEGKPGSRPKAALLFLVYSSFVSSCLPFPD